MARYIDVDVMQDDIIKLRKMLDINKCSNDYAVGWITGVDNMEGIIDRQPKADVAKVKHGYWIPVPSSDMSTGKAYKCSECKIMRYGCRLPPYCQECGAKMDLKDGVNNDWT